jgi:hypothetical protein
MHGKASMMIKLSKRTCTDKGQHITWGLAKNWQTERSSNFYFSIQLLFLARRYKSRSFGTSFGDINNNELLSAAAD